MRAKKCVYLTLLALVCLAASQVSASSIALDTMIGPAGTNAGSVAGAGNKVNSVGAIQETNATTLNKAGTVSYNFNTMPGGDRSTGFGTTGDSINWNLNRFCADRNYDGGTAYLWTFDRNNDATITGSELTAATGFGGQADTYITFDLAAIRTAKGLAADQAFVLTGGAGFTCLTNPVAGNGTSASDRALYGALTSGAILLDGELLQVFDFNKNTSDLAVYHTYSTYSLAISGTARYLTFAALTGLDLNTGTSGRAGYEHVSFDAPTLTTVTTPEPTSFVLLAVGLTGLLAYAWRKRK